MDFKYSLLHINGTIKHLKFLDYALNKYSHKKWGQKQGSLGPHFIQLLSYFTHPIDVGVQALAYPALQAANPFVTLGVNIANKSLWKLPVNTLLIPVKLGLAVPKIFIFEAAKIVQLGWSILGFNTFNNVLIRGKRRKINLFGLKFELLSQTEKFFWNRRLEEIAMERINGRREDFKLTPRKIKHLQKYMPQEIHDRPPKFYDGTIGTAFDDVELLLTNKFYGFFHRD